MLEHPGLSVQPCGLGELEIAGQFDFTAEFNGQEIRDAYELRIAISRDFPLFVPKVWETADRISETFHKLNDCSLCLGSRLRLQLMITSDPTISSFARKTIIPYLFSYSYLQLHGELPFGDLAHGVGGLIDDYKRIFLVSSSAAAQRMVYLAASERRKANKHVCPCGSGVRVGKCHNTILNRLRGQLGRRWFRDEYDRLVGERTRHHKLR